ncbi:lipid droplet assembly factor 1 isoform X2 [Mixophyes fleayi]|uniref:lipid droplet assembly factor 1 isoform X2 n=1 Tax=Mixophyes fleayi TaxID=3061075 RepID=UPI003F4D9BF6
MTHSEGLCKEKMQELQKQVNSLMQSINNNSKVVAFMNSPVGQYLDERPFMSLSLLVFVALSAVPVGLFLTVIAGTAVTACLGVIIIEGCLRKFQTGLGLVTLILQGKLRRTALITTRKYNLLNFCNCGLFPALIL